MEISNDTTCIDCYLETFEKSLSFRKYKPSTLNNYRCLGCVDKKDSPARLAVIQDHLYVGGDLGTQSDVRRRMGIL